ncbi:ATP-dependent RNA helicase DHX8 [Geopyxis carbonaria]|nr:ATP-dependent RNA helicase DHX8 [Geopyxis carbonaria]
MASLALSAHSILNRLPFDDGLTHSSASPARLQQLLSAPAPGSTQRGKTKHQHASDLASLTSSSIKKGDSSSPPRKPQTAPSAATEEQPKSKRRLKAEAKATAWQQKIAQRRTEERAQAAKEGKLEEFEAERKKKEETIATAKATQQQRLLSKKRPGTGNEEPEHRDGKKRKMSEPLPLLNGAPIVQHKAHIAQIKAHAAKLLSARRKLPIWEHQDNLRKCLREKDVLVMLGQTGSGKSTQLAQFLIDEPWMRQKNGVGGCIAITQPRRVAATSLARRVAQEMGVRLGEEVGYSVRFDSKYSKDTKIKFMTDGMLMQEMLKDPELKQYSAVFVDEAHERTVDTDLVMGFLRGLVYGKRRGNMKVVIMSATMEMEVIAKYYEEFHGETILQEIEEAVSEENPEPVKEEPEKTTEEKTQLVTPPASNEDGTQEKKKKKKKKKKKNTMQDLIRTPSPVPESSQPTVTEPVVEEDPQQVNPYRYYGSTAVFAVPGRQFAVEVFHSPEPVQDYVETILKVVLQVHVGEPLPGDILVFLTGQEEIVNLQKLLEDFSLQLDKDVPKLLVLPLYAALPPNIQQRVFEPTPPRTRKVILSTNIAETSVTISGVRHVVDCGKSKQKQFRPSIGLESLLVEPISRSSALQRAGRAGREAPGKCYRIYTESAFAELSENTTPEILRCDLAHAILRLKARGADIQKFSYLSQPTDASLFKALEQLYTLGALDNTGALTPVGQRMSTLPLTPPLARVLLAAAQPEFACLSEVIDIISLLQAADTPFLPSPFDEAGREAWEEAQKRFRRHEGDLLLLLELYRAYSAVLATERTQWCKTHFVVPRTMTLATDIRKQLRQTVGRFAKGALSSGDDSEQSSSISPDLAERILKAFLRGYFSNTARLQGDGRSYVTVVGGQDVVIHPSSSLMGEKREAVVFMEFVFTTKPWGRVCSSVRMDWIAEAAPNPEKV